MGGSRHAIESTLYLVDDDEDVLEVLTQALHEPSRKLVSFCDPIMAITTLMQRPADLLVVDLSMPWLGGAELIADAQAQLPALDIVLISGYARAAGIAESSHVTFLRKPLDLRKLREHVSRLLQRKVESFARHDRLPP